MRFDNTYARLPGAFYAHVQAEHSPTPELLAWNQELAEQLGLGELGDDPKLLAEWFSGNALLPGSEPIALAYAGHQFGHYSPQLGDGRALLLGELLDANGERFDLQLKGSGPTPYSRRGDGRSALGPVIREFVVSEAMHRLGVPSTRALAAVSTGARVMREAPMPGGVLTRVASSHIRVGTFQYFAAQNDEASLQTLVDYVIERHYPQVAGDVQPTVALFREVLERQAKLVAQWMSFGFIHGVMNTDNVTISGQTLDYGPCAFMDSFNYHQVFSSIDQMGRYAYSQQAPIQHWNMARLAEALLPLGEPQSAFEEALDTFPAIFEAAFQQRMGQKLGLQTVSDGDDELISAFMQLMQDEQRDFTLSFRRLAERLEGEGESRFGDFEARWRERLVQQGLPVDEVRSAMLAVNPLYIPRNHLVERAIQAAIAGDMSVTRELHAVLSDPFNEQPGFEAYALPPAPDELVTETFCGT